MISFMAASRRRTRDEPGGPGRGLALRRSRRSTWAAYLQPEQVRQLLRRHAPAFVGHQDRNVNAGRLCGDADGGSTRESTAPRWRRRLPAPKSNPA